MGVGQLSSLMVETMAEGKLIPVQARQDQEDGPCKGRQCQETPICSKHLSCPFYLIPNPPEIIHAPLPFAIL